MLTPGLVNAHAHLELSELRGRVPGRSGFVSWIRALMAERGRFSSADFVRAARAGAAELVAAGTTCVGDIDSTGVGDARQLELPLRRVGYREVLDAWQPDRTPSVLERVDSLLETDVRERPRTESTELPYAWLGFSPHAPYTTSAELLTELVRRLRSRRRRARSVPMAIHWAETEDEVSWLEAGEGPLAAILGASPRTSGLKLLADTGCLGPGTSLIHGNFPARGDPARLAAAGSALVHCPGTHAFFARPDFPWRRYVRAGVRLALGTDSLASNEALDMRREMALARDTLPGLSPERAWRMATVDAAHALGLGQRVGELRRGAAADLVLHHVQAGAGRRSLLEALTSGAGEVACVWSGARAVFGSGAQ